MPIDTSDNIGVVEVQVQITNVEQNLDIIVTARDLPGSKAVKAVSVELQ